MKQLWELFNGHKTTIAAIIMMAAIFGNEVVIDIWQYNPHWMPKLIQTFNWIGMSLGGIGIAHKTSKVMKK